jgi:hypothetical protein
VKEMEKMKNKREEKRAQNSEIRIKRAQVLFFFFFGVILGFEFRASYLLGRCCTS